MMQNKAKYIARTLSRGTNKIYETYVINSIYNKLNNFNIEISTQQYINTSQGIKYIDLYFPQLKIAIEVDEFYHDSIKQQELDQERMKLINNALMNSIINVKKEEVTFFRIQIHNNGIMKSIEEINCDINRVVNNINDRIKEKEDTGQKFEWVFDEQKKIQKIIAKGYLERGDSFLSMKDILHVFGKEVKVWQKCTYQVQSLNILVWSPTLSFKGTNRNGWINIISDDMSIIYESGVNGKSKTVEDAQKDMNNQIKRAVFAKYKDVLGNNIRRFIGLYECIGYDEKRQAEIWTLCKDKLLLKTNDKMKN